MEKIILTEHLILRPFEITDAESMYRNVHGDRETALSLNEEAFTDISQTELFIAQRIPHYGRRHFYDWAVIVKQTRQAVGEINAAYSSSENAADIGYVIGAAYRRRGYASEAVKAVSEFLFDEGIETVYGACRTDNTASIRVMEKAGMRKTDQVPERIREAEDHDDLQWYCMKRR